MINRKMIFEEVKNCSKKLGLGKAKVSLLIVNKSAKNRLGNLELEGDIYANLLPLKSGYKIRFNITTINDNKLNRKQLRGLVFHELTHILRHEYTKFIRGKDKISYAEFVKANKNYSYWHGSSIISDINELEELLIDIFVTRLCILEGFSWGLPIEDESGEAVNDRNYLSKRAEDFYSSLKEKISNLNV